MNADGSYHSPINAACQMNHLVLFTDGVANEDMDSQTTVKICINPSVHQAPIAASLKPPATARLQVGMARTLTNSPITCVTLMRLHLKVSNILHPI